MNIEELQALWKTQPAPALAGPEVLRRVKADAREFDEKIRRRDRRESLAALALALMYLLPSRKAVGPLWPQVVAVVICLLVPAFAIVARRRLAARAPSAAGDVQGELARGLGHTRLQEVLLTRVAWWYLLPIWVTGLLMQLHRDGRLTARWWTTELVLVLPIFVFVYWLNRRAVRKQLQPRVARLAMLQDEWRNLAVRANPKASDHA